MKENGINIGEQMGHMDDNIEMSVKIIENIDEKIPKGDYVGQGSHDDKNSTYFKQPSINKNSLKGFDFNTRSNQGGSTGGIELPKIKMRRFDGKDPIT